MTPIQRILNMPHYLYGSVSAPPKHRDRPFAAPTRAVISPDGTRYESMSEAAVKNGLVRGQIYAAIRGRTHCRAGWRYA